MPTPNPPEHVACIMDGSAHWARYRGRNPLDGDPPLAEPFRALIDTAIEQGVSRLTLLPAPHASGPDRLTERLIEQVLDRELRRLHGQGVRIQTLGDEAAGLPVEVAGKLGQARALTADNTALCLTVAVDHDGREDLLAAVQALVTAHEADTGATGTAADRVTADALARRLHRDGALPDVDLVIRTGGLHSLSGMLPWHCAHAELAFLDVLWPDFTAEHFRQALELYQLRRRRRDELTVPAAPTVTAAGADVPADGPSDGAGADGPGGAPSAHVTDAARTKSLGVGRLVTLPAAVALHMGGNLVANLHDTVRFAKTRLGEVLIGSAVEETTAQSPMPHDVTGQVTGTIPEPPAPEAPGRAAEDVTGQVRGKGAL